MPGTDDSRGRRAVRIAAWRLLLAGCRLPARRHHTPADETDPAARRGPGMVEGTARPTEALVRQAVSDRRRRIEMAGRRFPATDLRCRGAAVRFDVGAAASGRPSAVIPAAWRDAGDHRGRVA